jgi:hypothetical protein
MNQKPVSPLCSGLATDTQEERSDALPDKEDDDKFIASARKRRRWIKKDLKRKWKKPMAGPHSARIAEEAGPALDRWRRGSFPLSE